MKVERYGWAYFSLLPTVLLLRVTVTVCQGWGAGVFVPSMGFGIFNFCGVKGGVRIRPLLPCPAQQDVGQGVGFGFGDKCGTKRAA